MIISGSKISNFFIPILAFMEVALLPEEIGFIHLWGIVDIQMAEVFQFIRIILLYLIMKGIMIKLLGMSIYLL